MLDSTNRVSKSNTYNNLNINAITGTILKNYADSFFLRFNLRSELGQALLNKSPRMQKEGYCAADIVVIQIVICGDMEVIAEVIWKDDFDKLMKTGVTNENP